jgi:hypothetical protein
MNHYLRFQFETCSGTSQVFFSSRNVFLASLMVAFLFDFYWFSIAYIALIVFSIVAVVSEKGLPLTHFFKRYSTPDIFIKYCGNPLSALVGGAAKIGSKGTGKVALALGGIVVGQDAFQKSKMGQRPQYAVEKVLNNGVHPSNEPFTFKPNGPSWADNVSKRVGGH